MPVSTEKIIVFRITPQANTNTRIQFRLPGNVTQVKGWYALITSGDIKDYTGYLTLNFSNGVSKPVQMQKISQVYQLPKGHIQFYPLCEMVCTNSSVNGYYRDASIIATVNYTVTIYLQCFVNLFDSHE